MTTNNTDQDRIEAAKAVALRQRITSSPTDATPETQAEAADTRRKVEELKKEVARRKARHTFSMSLTLGQIEKLEREAAGVHMDWEAFLAKQIEEVILDRPVGAFLAVTGRSQDSAGSVRGRSDWQETATKIEAPSTNPKIKVIHAGGANNG